MEYQIDVNTYLSIFDQILYTMSSKMFEEFKTESITINFIDCMIPHHQAAIYMCENLLQYTQNRDLKRIASNIIQTQEKGIREMIKIRNTTSYLYNSDIDMYRYLEEYLSITEEMVNRMSNSPRCFNIDLDFINEMIPHHEGAIKMCHNLLMFSIDPRLARVAENIIQEQSRGVEELYHVREQLCQ